MPVKRSFAVVAAAPLSKRGSACVEFSVEVIITPHTQPQLRGAANRSLWLDRRKARLRTGWGNPVPPGYRVPLMRGYRTRLPRVTQGAGAVDFDRGGTIPQPGIRRRFSCGFS